MTPTTKRWTPENRMSVAAGPDHAEHLAEKRISPGFRDMMNHAHCETQIEMVVGKWKMAAIVMHVGEFGVVLGCNFQRFPGHVESGDPRAAGFENGIGDPGPASSVQHIE
jgi:hypothetical protein